METIKGEFSFPLLLELRKPYDQEYALSVLELSISLTLWRTKFLCKKLSPSSSIRT